MPHTRGPRKQGRLTELVENDKAQRASVRLQRRQRKVARQPPVGGRQPHHASRQRPPPSYADDLAPGISLHGVQAGRGPVPARWDSGHGFCHRAVARRTGAVAEAAAPEAPPTVPQGGSSR